MEHGQRRLVLFHFAQFGEMLLLNKVAVVMENRSKLGDVVFAQTVDEAKR